MAHREPEAPQPEPSVARRIWDQVGTLALAIAVALLLRAMVIESYYVPSESMLPTLLIGDHVFVNKFAYGSRVPLTGLAFPAVREPERGDLVIFALGRSGGRICPLHRCPDYAAEGFVKRLVGLPGDTIEVRDGIITVNGDVQGVRFTGEAFRDDHGRTLRVGREKLGGCVHSVLDLPGVPGPEQHRFTVPEGEYFMMGDNRDDSNDSRRWGTVAREHLKGPVIGIYWSWNNRGTWLSMLNPITWWNLLTGETRWGRMGMGLGCEDA